MATLDTLVVKINADLAGFDKQMGRAERRVTRFGRSLQSAGRTLTLGLTLPLAGVAAASVRAATSLDSLTRGLAAVGGGSAAAERQLVRLQEVAKLPGLGFAEAIQGSVRLQAVGFSAEFAERSLKAFGNAIATTGGGKDELARVTVQLGQLGAKGKVLAQDLRPIIEAAPLVGRALQEAFGTVDAEQIQKLGLTSEQFLDRLLTQLEQMPQVSRSAKTSFEDFGDAMFRAGSALGNIVLPPLVRFLDSATALLDGLSDVNPVILKFGLAIGGLAAIIGPSALALGTFIKLLPTLKIGLAALGTVSTGPIGLAVIAVTALAGAWLKVKSNAESARKAQAEAVAQWEGSLAGMSQDELKAEADEVLKLRNDAARRLEELNASSQQRLTGQQREQIERRKQQLQAEVNHYQALWVRALAAQRNAVTTASTTGTHAIGFQTRALDQNVATVERLLERQRELGETIAETQFEQRFVNSAEAAEKLNEKLADARRELQIVNAELAKMPAALIRVAQSQALLARFKGLGEPPVTARGDDPRARARAFLPEFALRREVLPPLEPVEGDKKRGLLETLGLGSGGLGEAFTQLTQAAGPLFVAFNLVKGALEPLQPVIEALGEPIRIVGAMIGGILTPVLKAIIPPLRLVGIVATYVVEALGWLIENIAKFINKIIPFVDPLKGVERFGRNMREEAREARNALNDMGKAADDLGKTLTDVSESIRNVPLSYNLNLLRTRLAQGAGGVSGTSAGGVSIGTVNIQAAPGDQPRDLWNKFVQGAKDAASGGDPFARSLALAGA